MPMAGLAMIPNSLVESQIIWANIGLTWSILIRKRIYFGETLCFFYNSWKNWRLDRIRLDLEKWSIWESMMKKFFASIFDK